MRLLFLAADLPANRSRRLGAAHGRKTILLSGTAFSVEPGTASGVTTFCGCSPTFMRYRKIVHGWLTICWRASTGLAPQRAASRPSKTKGLAYDTTAYKAAATICSLAAASISSFHAFGVGVVAETDGPTALIVEPSRAPRHSWPMFIDCSGDCDLAAWAGAPSSLATRPANLMYPTMTVPVNGVDPALAGGVDPDPIDAQAKAGTLAVGA